MIHPSADEKTSRPGRPGAHQHPVKAHDIRGLVPEEFDEAAARTVGAANAAPTGADLVAVARDTVRATAPRNREVAV